MVRFFEMYTAIFSGHCIIPDINDKSRENAAAAAYGLMHQAMNLIDGYHSVWVKNASDIAKNDDAARKTPRTCNCQTLRGNIAADMHILQKKCVNFLTIY